MLHTFHYYAPGPEEQRGFAMQVLGTVIGLGLVAFFGGRSSDNGVRGMLVGAGLALVFRLISAAWRLEKKARRAQNCEIGVDENGLHLIDENGKAQRLTWDEIQDIGLKGGRLNVKWQNGSLAVGSREIEDGMTLVRLVMQRGQDNQDQPPRKSNFIPLEPL